MPQDNPIATKLPNMSEKNPIVTPKIMTDIPNMTTQYRENPQPKDTKVKTSVKPADYKSVPSISRPQISQGAHLRPGVPKTNSQQTKLKQKVLKLTDSQGNICKPIYPKLDNETPVGPLRAFAKNSNQVSGKLSYSKTRSNLREPSPSQEAVSTYVYPRVERRETYVVRPRSLNRTWTEHVLQAKNPQNSVSRSQSKNRVPPRAPGAISSKVTNGGLKAKKPQTSVSQSQSKYRVPPRAPGAISSKVTNGGLKAKKPQASVSQSQSKNRVPPRAPGAVTTNGGLKAKKLQASVSQSQSKNRVAPRAPGAVSSKVTSTNDGLKAKKPQASVSQSQSKNRVAPRAPGAVSSKVTSANCGLKAKKPQASVLQSQSKNRVAPRAPGAVSSKVTSTNDGLKAKKPQASVLQSQSKNRVAPRAPGAVSSKVTSANCGLKAKKPQASVLQSQSKNRVAPRAPGAVSSKVTSANDGLKAKKPQASVLQSQSKNRVAPRAPGAVSSANDGLKAKKPQAFVLQSKTLNQVAPRALSPVQKVTSTTLRSQTKKSQKSASAALSLCQDLSRPLINLDITIPRDHNSDIKQSQSVPRSPTIYQVAPRTPIAISTNFSLKEELLFSPDTQHQSSSRVVLPRTSTPRDLSPEGSSQLSTTRTSPIRFPHLSLRRNTLSQSHHQNQETSSLLNHIPLAVRAAWSETERNRVLLEAVNLYEVTTGDLSPKEKSSESSILEESPRTRSISFPDLSSVGKSAQSTLQSCKQNQETPSVLNHIPPTLRSASTEIGRNLALLEDKNLYEVTAEDLSPKGQSSQLSILKETPRTSPISFPDLSSVGKSKQSILSQSNNQNQVTPDILNCAPLPVKAPWTEIGRNPPLLEARNFDEITIRDLSPKGRSSQLLSILKETPRTNPILSSDYNSTGENTQSTSRSHNQNQEIPSVLNRIPPTVRTAWAEIGRNPVLDKDLYEVTAGDLSPKDRSSQLSILKERPRTRPIPLSYHSSTRKSTQSILPQSHDQNQDTLCVLNSIPLAVREAWAEIGKKPALLEARNLHEGISSCKPTSVASLPVSRDVCHCKACHKSLSGEDSSTSVPESESSGKSTSKSIISTSPLPSLISSLISEIAASISSTDLLSVNTEDLNSSSSSSTLQTIVTSVDTDNSSTLCNPSSPEAAISPEILSPITESAQRFKRLFLSAILEEKASVQSSSSSSSSSSLSKRTVRRIRTAPVRRAIRRVRGPPPLPRGPITISGRKVPRRVSARRAATALPTKNRLRVLSSAKTLKSITSPVQATKAASTLPSPRTENSASFSRTPYPPLQVPEVPGLDRKALTSIATRGEPSPVSPSGGPDSVEPRPGSVTETLKNITRPASPLQVPEVPGLIIRVLDSVATRGEPIPAPSSTESIGTPDRGVPQPASAIIILPDKDILSTEVLKKTNTVPVKKVSSPYRAKKGPRPAPPSRGPISSQNSKIPKQASTTRARKALTVRPVPPRLYRRRVLPTQKVSKPPGLTSFSFRSSGFESSDLYKTDVKIPGSIDFSMSAKFVPKRVPSNEAVQVVVRCRPMNDKEMAAGFSRVIECYPARGAIEITNPSPKDSRESTKIFTFDAVYDWNSRQDHLYDETIRPLVASVLDGFNGTIFAYGQTGTGKTFTMEGVKNDPNQKGVIPKSFEQIFNHISRSSNIQYLVRTSYLEIYQEEIRDLLAKDQNKRYELRESTEVGVYVKDLSSFVCRSVKEIEHVMSLGNQNRKIGATNMNEHSSRSHAIFLITVEMSGVSDMKVVRVGKLNLVDLAGSERQSKTGATGERLKEASKINLSLSALGNVISALVMSTGKATHIPYRDSKLTRILQDSLGGNSKTIMIANVGPASYNYDESLTTLRYANRAKNIKNKPRVNEDPKDALLRQYKVEIARLKALLESKLKERQAFGDQQKMRGDQKSNLKNKKHHANALQAEPDESNKKNKLSKYTDEDRQRRCAEIEHNKLLLAQEKQLTEELESKIAAMESKLLCGGRNIIDHTNEQQRALEQRNAEIAERKRREVEMRQRLDVQEESCVDLRGTYSDLQQEAEVKTKKLKKLFTKLQVVKEDIHDIGDEYNRDRRELELTQNEMLKELKLKYLIIENFIPVEEKNRFLSRLWYDEDYDQWCLSPHSDVDESPSIATRPVSADDERRPVSEYSRVAIQVGRYYRYHGENILSLELDPHTRTTSDYQSPLIAPKIKAVLEEALKDDEVIDVDASALNINNASKSKSARKERDKDKRVAEKHAKLSKTSFWEAKASPSDCDQCLVTDGGIESDVQGWKVRSTGDFFYPPEDISSGVPKSPWTSSKITSKVSSLVSPRVEELLRRQKDNSRLGIGHVLKTEDELCVTNWNCPCHQNFAGKTTLSCTKEIVGKTTFTCPEHTLGMTTFNCPEHTLGMTTFNCPEHTLGMTTFNCPEHTLGMTTFNCPEHTLGMTTFNCPEQFLGMTTFNCPEQFLGKTSCNCPTQIMGKTTCSCPTQIMGKTTYNCPKQFMGNVNCNCPNILTGENKTQFFENLSAHEYSEPSQYQFNKSYIDLKKCRCGHFCPEPFHTVQHNELFECNSPMEEMYTSHSEGSVIYGNIQLFTAICCVIYLFRIVYILQIVVVSVISLFFS